MKKDFIAIVTVIILGLIWYYGVLTYGWNFGIWYIILFPFAFLITTVPLIIFLLIIIGEFKDFP